MRVNAQALFSALLTDLEPEIDTRLPSWAPDSTSRQVACYVLRDAVLKKFNPTDRPTHSATAAAMEKFLAVNKRCGEWIIPYETSIDEQLIGEVKLAMYEFWNHNQEPCVSSFNQLFHAGRAGPGASVAARDSDFYTKMFDGPLTATTEDLHFVWERMSGTLPLWSDASLRRQRSWPTSVVESSKYSFVNKTTTIARGICTEPSVNMWFQLGFGACLDRRLRSVYGYDSALQPDRNRVMARRGSLDGSLATIDLESASDSVSLNVLKEILPKSFFDWLNILRSPRTTLPNGEVVALNMVSTMGNGYTFPLQTALFFAVVKSAYKLLGIPLNRGWTDNESVDPYAIKRNFSVFGDDIIVDHRAARLVLRGLHLLGFVANKDKTFVEGPFRESCGADYVDGINVRGVYIKSLNTQQDVCVAINNLNRWSAKSGVSLINTVHVLLRGISHHYRRFVPFDMDDAAGIHVPEEMLEDYNPRVSKFYWAQGVKVNSHVVLRSYRAWEPLRVDLEIRENFFFATVEGLKARNYNPSGLMLAFLGGYIRGYRILLRQRDIRYTTKPGFTPNWGWARPRPLEYHIGYSGNRLLVDACVRNLSGFRMSGE